MRKRLLFVVNVAWFFTSHRLPVALLAKEAGFEVHLAAVFELGERARIESLGISSGFRVPARALLSCFAICGNCAPF